MLVNRLELLKEAKEIFLSLIFIELTGINSSNDGLLFSSDIESTKFNESFWLKKPKSSISSEDWEEKFEGKGDFNLIYWFDLKIGRTSILISSVAIFEVIISQLFIDIDYRLFFVNYFFSLIFNQRFYN